MGILWMDHVFVGGSGHVHRDAGLQRPLGQVFVAEHPRHLHDMVLAGLHLHHPRVIRFFWRRMETLAHLPHRRTADHRLNLMGLCPGEATEKEERLQMIHGASAPFYFRRVKSLEKAVGKE